MLIKGIYGTLHLPINNPIMIIVLTDGWMLYHNWENYTCKINKITYRFTKYLNNILLSQLVNSSLSSFVPKCVCIHLQINQNCQTCLLCTAGINGLILNLQWVA